MLIILLIVSVCSFYFDLGFSRLGLEEPVYIY